MKQLNVNKMLRSLTASQFVEWEQYAALEPFGKELDDRNQKKQDYRTANIVQMVFNMAVDPKHRKTLSKFVLEWKEGTEQPPKQKDWKDLKRTAMMLVDIYNAEGVTT